MSQVVTNPLQILTPPYERLKTCRGAPSGDPALTDARGAGLVWHLSEPISQRQLESVRTRPRGVSLVVVLPEHTHIRLPSAILRVIELCRPQSILPYHQSTCVEDLKTALRRPPSDLATEVLDYLTWRGMIMSITIRQLVRRTLHLSRELRTVKSLSRALYLSRRALGRKYSSACIPVPSHWLQLGRLLRATIRIQNSDDSLFVVALALGYPDGFALSNQMHRLLGVRPSEVRDRLGWEWVLEAWIESESKSEGFGQTSRAQTDRRPVNPPAPEEPEDTPATSRPDHGLA
jgi:AraC-like DNA-binding protein